MPSVSLEIKNVSKVFRTGILRPCRRTILENISFEVRAGQTFGIMGGSGIGKTTLGLIISGLDEPTTGEVRFEGQNIFRMQKEEYAVFRRKVQMVFQNPEGSLNPRKTIGKSLEEVLFLVNMPKIQRHQALREVLDSVGLSKDILRRYPHQVSGGQNQRVVLGRVLLLEPDFIILDEPTSALDIAVQAQILQLLKTLQEQRGLGYILISHDSHVIRFLSHRTGIIEDKRLLTHFERQ